MTILCADCRKNTVRGCKHPEGRNLSLECVDYLSPAENDKALDDAYAQTEMEWDIHNGLKELVESLKDTHMVPDNIIQGLKDAVKKFEADRTPPFPGEKKTLDDDAMDKLALDEELEAYEEHLKTPEGMLEYLTDQVNQLRWIDIAAKMRDEAIKWWATMGTLDYEEEPKFVTLAKELESFKKGG